MDVALKLKVRWSAPVAAQSYPIVAGGRVFVPVLSGSKVHVRALDATTGKSVTGYPKDALGGLLVSGGVLYLAGHVLQAVDPSTGQRIARIAGAPSLPGSTFVAPQADAKYLFAGYYSGARNSIPTIPPEIPRLCSPAAELLAWAPMPAETIRIGIATGNLNAVVSRLSFRSG